LQTAILANIKRVLDQYAGAWLVWCDPRGDWEWLLKKVNAAAGEESFTLRTIDEHTAGAFGSPQARKHLQEWIKTGQGFVLRVTTTEDDLGWLSAQALLAEEIQNRSLRLRLRDWGWRPQNMNTSDDDVARLARKFWQAPLDEWGTGQATAEPFKLLEVLAGSPQPWQENSETGEDKNQDESENQQLLQDQRTVLELTLDEAGLPPINELDLERWRLDALAHLLVTQANHVTPQYYAGHEYLIAPEKRAYALREILERWLDSVRLRKGLPERILNADRILSLGKTFPGSELGARPYLSQDLERSLFANSCAQLTERRGRALLEALAPLSAQFEKHAVEGFWGDKNSQAGHPQSLPWSELARLSRAARELLAAAPVQAWTNPEEAVSWYIRQGWRIEQTGAEIMRQLSKPTPEMLKFITPLREAYAHHWEQYLIQWSDLWLQAGCPVPSLTTQGTWLKEQLKKETHPTAVIMLDALRYDIGIALSQQINAREGEVERAKVSPARTAIPSITALGMGLALPIDESELEADIVNGKWQLSQQGQDFNLSLAEKRREWLKIRLKIAPENLLNLDKKGASDIPRASGKNARLFLFDATIDKLGHDEELEPFGTREVEERYIQAIEQLRDKGWMRVLVVTDHGFLHWPDFREQRVHLPLYNPAYSARRALAYEISKDTARLKGPHALAPGGKWYIALTHGAECFRSYGGLGYFHGGASLQEWIVPCIEIKWPVTAQPVKLRIQPLPQILSLRSKVTLEVQHEGHLFADENELPREVEILMRDEQERVIFASERKLVTPSDAQLTVTLVPKPDAEAERGTQLRLDLRDAQTHEVIDTHPTTLMVDLENW
jgi:hypothetical protein